MTDQHSITDVDVNSYAAEFVELWNEADPERRAAAVRHFWAPAGANYTPTIEATGHDEIIARVTRSFDKNVGPGTFRFRPLGSAGAHHGVVMVRWEMVEVATGRQAAVGVEVLVLDDVGRIATDHQFILG